MAEEGTSVAQAPQPPAPPAPPGTAAPQSPMPGGHQGGSGMVWFGVVLLVVGAGIIVERVVPGLSFWGFWPASIAGILFIVFGIRGMLTSLKGDDSRLNKVVEGFTGITVGIILIANSIGAVAWSAWWSVLSLWPVLLVSAGLDLIGKGLRSTWLRVLSSVVVLVALWYGAFVMPVASVPRTWWSAGSSVAEPFEFTEPSNPDVTTADAQIEGAVGSMTIADGSALVSVQGRSAFGEPVFETSVSGSGANVEVHSSQDGPLFLGTGGDSRIDVEIDRDVVWDLTIVSGVSDLSARLADLTLSGLRFKTGVANAQIELGDTPDGDVPVTFEAGISQLTLRIPRDAEVRIERSAGLSNTSVDDDLSAVEGGWETTGYEDAADRYTVRLKSGISDFRVELY